MRQDERGFTLIELIAVIAIAALIVAGAGMTTWQISRGSESSQDLTTVANQGHNVGYWLSHDILTAQSVNASDDTGTGDIEFVVLRWKDWETGDTHDIRYIWLDSTDSLQKLKRKHLTRDKNGVEISSKMTLIADNIYSANLIQEDDRWKLTVETHSGEKSVTRDYAIGQRQGA